MAGRRHAQEARGRAGRTGMLPVQWVQREHHSGMLSEQCGHSISSRVEEGSLGARLAKMSMARSANLPTRAAPPDAHESRVTRQTLFHPSRNPSTEWHRRQNGNRRRNGTASQY